MFSTARQNVLHITRPCYQMKVILDFHTDNYSGVKYNSKPTTLVGSGNTADKMPIMMIYHNNSLLPDLAAPDTAILRWVKRNACIMKWHYQTTYYIMDMSPGAD